MGKEDRIYNPDRAVLSSGIGVTPSEQVKLRDKKKIQQQPPPHPWERLFVDYIVPWSTICLRLLDP